VALAQSSMGTKSCPLPRLVVSTLLSSRRFQPWSMLTDEVLEPTTTRSLQREHGWDVGRNALRLPMLPMVAVAVARSRYRTYGRFRGPHPILLPKLSALGVEGNVGAVRHDLTCSCPVCLAAGAATSLVCRRAWSPSQTSSPQRGSKLARHEPLCVALRAGHTGPTSSLPCRLMRRLIGLVRHATLPTESAQH
jgi:hypothetical protein